MFKQINSILNKFLEPFECEACKDEDFAYYYASNYITYTLVCSEIDNRCFMEKVHKIAPNLNCDIFLASFFHELGHHMTMEDLDEEELDFSYIMKREIDEWDFTREEANRFYMDLPDEDAATRWGCQYMLEHQAEVAQLWSKLQPAILGLYKEMVYEELVG